MKKLIAVVLFSLTSLAFASNTGHVHFQSESTWVNPVTNKTLCYDNGMFYAKVVSCVETRLVRGEEECVKWGKKTISQPVNSTRMVCLEESGDNGLCTMYGMVAYGQSVERDVDYYGTGYNRTGTVTVPCCK